MGKDIMSALERKEEIQEEKKITANESNKKEKKRDLSKIPVGLS